MTTALPTAPSAYGLKGPSAAITVDNATPQGATYLRGNTVQTNGTSSPFDPNHTSLMPTNSHHDKKLSHEDWGIVRCLCGL